MNFFIKTEKKGSALLVVLGFLTFMIISAVSFSIYMRTERQASSNYRHSVTARHLLESALYRAMDEVDADLRGVRYTYPMEVPTTSEPLTKFPTHVQWEGRVFTSKSNTPEIEDARVLSLEALSFLPAAVVNDARYYSASTPDQKAFGAKWRRMSMPITARVDIDENEVTSAGNKSFVGRYAYICVNLSDMPNVNGCTNAVRGVSNLVSVASLFADQNTELINWTKAQKFAEQTSKDISYTTLQDFYACMAKENYFDPPSPHIQFLQGGGNTVFNEAEKHLLVTDGFAKERAVDTKKVCNLGDPQGQPLTKTVLEGTGNVDDQLQSDFVKAIKLVEPLAPDSYIRTALPGLLADYLSEDSKLARGLAAPAVKLTPMICQFIIKPLLYSEVRKSVEVVNGKPETTLELQLFPDLIYADPAIRNLSFQMRVCYPFKNISDVRRNRNYTIKVKGTVRVLPVRPDETRSDRLFAGVDFGFECEGSMNPGAGKPFGVPANPTEDECYVTVDPMKMALKGPAFDTKQVVKMLTVKEDGTMLTQNGFTVGKPFSVLFIIDKAQVFNPEGQLVDAVPYNTLVPTGALDVDSLPKLYFETQVETLVPTLADKKQLKYDWQSLEVPDPRFNHFTCNWVNNTDPGEAHALSGMHKLTRDLLAKDGRDCDIFMTVSGRKNLESPGELGFLIRPFEYKGGDPGANFRADNIEGKPGLGESDAFFRTFRLYAHDNRPRDNVYKYIINAVDSDGALPLANSTRINPLSTSKDILKMAISAVPYDYSPIVRKPTDNITDGVWGSTDLWKVFSDKWAEDIMKVVDAENLAKDLSKNIATCDSIAKMKWYDPDLPGRARLKCLDVSPLPKPLHEIDRKMLYAFSLDAMSDRQQLFLYVFQAESIAPISFAGMRSLSGGRAVALVWRDPYPKGSSPDTPNGLGGSWYKNAGAGGTKGYHEQKILFFKQLDN
jgi:hypothetical protein